MSHCFSLFARRIKKILSTAFFADTKQPTDVQITRKQAAEKTKSYLYLRTGHEADLPMLTVCLSPPDLNM